MKKDLAATVLGLICLILMTVRCGETERFSSALWMTAHDMDVVNGHAYCAMSNGLRIFDVSEPSRVRIVGEVGLPDTAFDLVVQNGHAYVACGSAGLAVVDVSDPWAPQRVGLVELAGTAFDIATDSHGFAYVALLDAGIATVDLSDSSNPYLRSIHEMDWPAYDLAWADGHLYVANGESGISVVAVSSHNLSAPRSRLDGSEVGDVRTVEVVNGMLVTLAISSAYEVVGSDRYGNKFGQYVDRWAIGSIELVDADTLGAPASFFTVSTLAPRPQHKNAIVSDGGQVFVNVNGFVEGAQITTEGLQRQFTIQLNGVSHGIDVEEGILYAYPRDTLSAWNVPKGQDQAQRIFEYSPLGTRSGLDYWTEWVTVNGGRVYPGVVNRVAANDSRIFVSAGYQGVQILELSKEGSLQVVGSYGGYGTGILRLAVEGDNLYLLETPTEPPASGPRYVFVSENSRYEVNKIRDRSGRLLNSGSRGELRVVDVQDPKRPLLIAAYGEGKAVEDFGLSNELAYLATREGLLAVSFADPDAPATLGTITDLAGTKIAPADDRIYLATKSEIVVVDASDVAAMRVIGKTSAREDDAAELVALVAADDLVAAAYADSSLELFDMGLPSSPRLKGSLQLKCEVGDLAFIEEDLLVACGATGILRVPYAGGFGEPGRMDTPGFAQDVATTGSRVVVADGASVLMLSP